MRHLIVLALVTLLAPVALSGQREAASNLRLYVFDCGTLASADMSRYRLRESDVATTRMSVACFLISHPRGVLMWDVGAVPDQTWTPTGRGELQHLTLPDGQMREVTMVKPLLPQLAAAGFTPASVTFLALS